MRVAAFIFIALTLVPPVYAEDCEVLARMLPDLQAKMEANEHNPDQATRFSSSVNWYIGSILEQNCRLEQRVKALESEVSKLKEAKNSLVY